MSVSQPLVMVQHLVAQKVEATTGTLEALTSAEVTIPVFNSKIEHDNDVTERKGPATSSPLPAVPGGKKATVECTIELLGKGSNSASLIKPYLQAAAFAYSAGVYTPTTGGSSQATLSMGRYLDGRAKFAAGVSLDATFKFEAGKPATIDLKGVGVWGGQSNVAMLSGFTLPDVQPPVFQSGVLTLGGTNMAVSKVEIAMGNKTYLRPDPNAASGYRAAVVVDRDIKISMDPEAGLARNLAADFEAGTTGALVLTIGSAGNGFTINVPKLQLVKAPEDADREGIVADSIQCICQRNTSAGDDEMTITEI